MARGFGSAAVQQGCPCGGGDYNACCGPFHQGTRRVSTAEQLMRSRYSAFALGEVDYLLKTHPQPDVPELQRRRDLVQICRQTRWLGLTIIQVCAGGPVDREGTVRFEARYRGGVLKETSLFQRRGGSCDGDWLYIGPKQPSD